MEIEVQDSLAAAVGMTPVQLRRGQAICKAAKEDAEAFGDLTEMMNTKGIICAWRELKRRKAAEHQEGPMTTKHEAEAKMDHGPFLEMAIGDLRPAPENNELYRPLDPRDPDLRALRDSIEEHGILEPLVVSSDNYIVSGHRRHFAAKMAGLEVVPVRVLDVWRCSDRHGFVRKLALYNKQRVKDNGELLRECVLELEPGKAYAALLEHRFRRSTIDAELIDIGEARARARITSAKQPMLNAVLRVLQDQIQFWPLSDRQIHYALLNDPPLVHASKSDVYGNDQRSYKNLVNLLTRARHEGIVSFNAIADTTRPVTTWRVDRHVGTFVRRELEQMLMGYSRDLLQSQPNHVEIIAEKLTVASILRPVAMRYTLPLTIGRGYSSTPPRKALADRFRESGKEELVLIFVTDHDPEGEDIARSFARSMRDDFGIDWVRPIKAALTKAQVEAYGLPPQLKAKAGSSRRKAFVAEHGENVHELEALRPQQLQELLEEAILSVIDTATFNMEIDGEREDAAFLEGARQRVHAALQDIDFDEATE